MQISFKSHIFLNIVSCTKTEVDSRDIHGFDVHLTVRSFKLPRLLDFEKKIQFKKQIKSITILITEHKL